MKIHHLLITACLLFTLSHSLTHRFGHQKTHEDHNDSSNIADIVFHNGHVVTMNSNNQTAEAVAVKGDTIIGVGKMEDLTSFIGENTKKVNLRKRTLVPGFYDAHSHYSLSAVLATQGFELFSAPFGNVTSIADIIANVKKYITDNNIPPGSNVYGSGYDQTKLAEKRFPTKVDLDQISTEHTILLAHYSGHMGTVNSLILQNLGTTNQTVVPGGTIVLGDDGQPNGVMKEQAIISYAAQYWGKITAQKAVEGQSIYFQVGYTTAQDATTDGSELRAYIGAGDKLKLDISTYQFVKVNSPNPLLFYYLFKDIKNKRLSMRGTKAFFDGSLQLETAALSKPYKTQPDGNSFTLPTSSQIDPVLQSQQCAQSWCGKPNFPQSTVNNYFKQLLDNDVDCIVHCNGDAAIQQFIEGVRSARNGTNLNQPTRLILNHGMTITEKQLDDVKALNIVVTFFPPQIYFNGDAYKNVFLGEQRAVRMNPANSALKRDIHVSLHTDAPVFPLNAYGPLQIISTAVNRKTITGNSIGQSQAITAYQALRGVTIDAAWQGREDSIKGSIEVGKKADLVILSKNPLTVKSSQIGKIKVLSTYKNGEQVYTAPKKSDDEAESDDEN